MKPSRRTQPYRKGPRTPGGALTAMMRGTAMNQLHPKHAERELQKKMRGRRRRKRRGSVARKS